VSYHIYTTEAVILKKRDYGEADRVFSFFTKDFGRMEIKAQGVRYLKSKLRYNLSGLSFLRIAFVSSGNEFCRLVDVEENLVLSDTRKDLGKTKCALRIFFLLDRLVQGQERDKELWNKIYNFFVFLENNKMNREQLKSFTTLTALDVVTHLGYAEGTEKHLGPVSVIRGALENSQL